MRKIAIALLGAAALSCVAFAATEKAAIAPWGFDLSGMDTSVKPGDDFFEYANGNWFKRTTIPSDRTSIGSFQQLRIDSENRMKALIADLHAKPAASLTPEEHQILDLYDGFTDTAGIEARGLAPVKSVFAKIAALKTLDDVAAMMGDPAFIAGQDADSIVADGIGADPKNSNVYVVTATQSGLGMPNRDYYLKTDDAGINATREAYKKYLATMLGLAGATKDVAARAAAVYALEEAIASSHWASAARRDADKTYNPMTVADLQKFAPGFNWVVYFKAQGINPDRKVIVRENTAFPPLADTFAKTPVAVWKDYLVVHTMHSAAAYLPKAIDDADFDFYGKMIGGTMQQLPRDSRAVALIDNVLPHPFGKLYAAKYFPPETKAKAEALVQNIIAAYDADIHKITWMSDATKAKALEKLHKFTPHIGYPDTWRRLFGPHDQARRPAGAISSGRARSKWKYKLDRIDQPVDPQ